MPVPSSGQLRLRADINQEVNGNDTDTNVSLGTLADDAGFDTPPDQMSEFYGYQSCTAPSITTDAMSNVSFTSMRANGNVTADNGCTVTERGFYFGTSGNMTSNTKYTSGSGTGSYNRTFSSLSTGTTYYAWAYAINSAGETQGSRVQATTSVPATYSLIADYYINNDHEWKSPQSQSWAHLQMSANASWSSNARAQYHHSSYGWSNYASYSNSWNGNNGRPSSNYSPVMRDKRYKRTDATEYTEHKVYHYVNFTQGTNPGYWPLSKIMGGDNTYPSGCTSGGNVGAYGSGSGCNNGCGSSYDINCNCNENYNWNSNLSMDASANGMNGNESASQYKQGDKLC
jgi:hypothetical protein